MRRHCHFFLSSFFPVLFSPLFLSTDERLASGQRRSPRFKPFLSIRKKRKEESEREKEREGHRSWGSTKSTRRCLWPTWTATLKTSQLELYLSIYLSTIYHFLSLSLPLALFCLSILLFSWFHVWSIDRSADNDRGEAIKYKSKTTVELLHRHSTITSPMINACHFDRSLCSTKQYFSLWLWLKAKYHSCSSQCQWQVSCSMLIFH